MATLVLSSVGTLVGGPVGGALSALAGRQLDRAVFGGPEGREGPRLKELTVSTSSYGTAIPAVLGRMRIAGTMVWASDIAESAETGGGGKGRPSTTSYFYSASFAVALSCLPIARVGRIWADGTLLRDSAGKLATGGTIRVHTGHSDQRADPLLASALGAQCPALRGRAYAVFEDLQLSEFGNRIPALAFEVIGARAPDDAATFLALSGSEATGTAGLPALEGYALEGETLRDALGGIDAVYPLAFTTSAGGVAVSPADALPSAVPLLPEAAASPDGEDFGAQSGSATSRAGDRAGDPAALRYYDPARDFQPGLQRSDGFSPTGRYRAIELPAAIAAGSARALADAAQARADGAADAVAWRVAALDPALRPGAVVRLPDRPGAWRVAEWEWRGHGVELLLERIAAHVAPEASDADPGVPGLADDLTVPPSLLYAFELPWDGRGDADAVRIHVAASAIAGGWRGAALYSEAGGVLDPVGFAPVHPATTGVLETPLAPSPALLLERHAVMDVRLDNRGGALAGATSEMLAQGSNRALVGNEVLQFAGASPLGEGIWRLTGLLRGRGGSEAEAQAGHAAGARFVLLDNRLVALGADDFGLAGPDGADSIAAIGMGDDAPVVAPVANRGAALRPPCPVHPRVRQLADGALETGWTRRARGGWTWNATVEQPLVEESELYFIGVGAVDAPDLQWDAVSPAFTLPADVRVAHAGAPLWVRQVGRHALSRPLLLAIL